MRGAGLPKLRAAAAGFLLWGLTGGAALPAWGQAPDGDRPSGGEAEARFLASPYLPLGHWAYPVLDHWIASGRVRSLSPFTRPYRRASVAAALQEILEAGPSAGEAAGLRDLQREFREELKELGGAPGGMDRIWADLSAGVGFYSQTHPDLLRPALDGTFSRSRILEHATLDVGAGFGNVAAGVRIRRDGLLRNDPRFPDGRVVLREGEAFLTELELRVEEAYVEIQGRRARLSFGRGYRNWGPAGTHGLLRSNAAFSFDEIGYRFGSDRIFLVGAVTSLPDATGDTVRFHAAHRLEVRLRENLVLAVSEASIHGGPGVRLDPRLISPLAIWELARDSERSTQSNLLAQLDVWWQPDPRLALFGSLLADSPPGVGACCESGGTLGVELPRLRQDLLVRARATAIQSLVYRTRRPWEEHSYKGVGLGWDKADVVVLTLEGHWLAGARLSLQPRLDLQLLGEESDFRGGERPGQAGLEDFPGILVGRHETTVRPSLGGRWRGGDRWQWDVDWDLGMNRIRHVRHEEGVHRTDFVGGVRLSLTAPRVGGGARFRPWGGPGAALSPDPALRWTPARLGVTTYEQFRGRMIPLTAHLKRSIRLRSERHLSRICFPHVPKCAGMAVARSIDSHAYSRLERRLFPAFSLDIRASRRAAGATSAEMMTLREEVLAYALAEGRYRFATGHVTSRPRLVDEFQGEWNFVTVLRDPVERWISEYVYNLGKKSDWARTHLPIQEYLGSPKAHATATSFLRYFSNIPRGFGGDPSDYIREATENLSRFAVVGRVEDLGGFAHSFRERFGRTLTIPTTNRSPDQTMKERIRNDPAVMERVRELCAADTEIYRKAFPGAGNGNEAP